MNPRYQLWLAAVYAAVIVGSAIKDWGRTFRLCLIVAFLAAVGITAWFMIGHLR